MKVDDIVKLVCMLSEMDKTGRVDDCDQSFSKGDLVLVRANQMGTHVGVVESHVVGGKLVFSKSRKLWRWAPKKGLALDSLAIYGADPERTKATAITNKTAINDLDCVGIIQIDSSIYEQLMSLDVEEQR